MAAVDHPGFRLHLDAGALALNGEDVALEIATSAPLLAHFHASEPYLAPVGTGEAAHDAIAEQLRAIAYDGTVAIGDAPAWRRGAGSRDRAVGPGFRAEDVWA